MNKRAYLPLRIVAWWLPAEAARNALAGGPELISAQEFQGNVPVALHRLCEPAT